MISTKQELDKLYELLIEIRTIKTPLNAGRVIESASGELIEASKYLLLAKGLFTFYTKGYNTSEEKQILNSWEELNLEGNEERVVFIKEHIFILIDDLKQIKIFIRDEYDLLLISSTITNCLSAIIFLDLELERLKQ